MALPNQVFDCLSRTTDVVRRNEICFQVLRRAINEDDSSPHVKLRIKIVVVRAGCGNDKKSIDPALIERA
jgi:hypothetical protein